MGWGCSMGTKIIAEISGVIEVVGGDPPAIVIELDDSETTKTFELPTEIVADIAKYLYHSVIIRLILVTHEEGQPDA